MRTTILSTCSAKQLINTSFGNVFVFTFLVFSCLEYCGARDNITTPHLISDVGPSSESQTLVSAGKKFELGFFTPKGRNGRTTPIRYLGIWYYKDNGTVVWVANRDTPLYAFNGVFGFDSAGNLVILDLNGHSYFSSNAVPSESRNPFGRTGKLLDTGNLILIDGSGNYLWQSFQHPTDTFLPGMKMDETLNLTSWASGHDPGNGSFTFKKDQDGGDSYSIILNRKYPRWKSGGSGSFTPTQMFSATVNFLSGLNSPLPWDYNNTRLLMNISGYIQYFSWDNQTGWVLRWSVPKDRCSVYNACGQFGSCNRTSSGTNKLMCECLPGFEPTLKDDWNSGDFSSGCIRKSSTKCSQNDTFLKLKMMRVEKPGPDSPIFDEKREEDCRLECVRECWCQAYSYVTKDNPTQNNETRPGCWIWKSELIDLHQGYVDGSHNLFIRVQAVSDAGVRNSTQSEGSQHKKTSLSLKLMVISVVVIVVVVLLCSISYISYRRMESKRKESKERIQGNPVLHLYDSERRVKDLIDMDQFREDGKKGIDVPFFDLETILAATHNFSHENKLGEGGFGPVYKGQFPGGQEIAVKRLSSHSGQGLEEFKNEVVLIAKLQHRNLVRLLGYCIQGDEKILLYEYMPNGSLDAFIFDQTLCMLLDWPKRFDIILGIARGLLYLHQDSRLRIIHRDLKASNVLLDEEMHPKISDFGLARIVGGKQTEANTNRVVGT